MKHTELRVGNYVLGPLGEIVIIDVIGDLNYPEYIHGSYKSETGSFYGQNGFEPIPLTPEILERCGFTSVSRNEDGTYNFWSKKHDASIDYDDKHIFRYRVHETLRTKNIIYVHELQNLHFALKGEELEVNL